MSWDSSHHIILFDISANPRFNREICISNIKTIILFRFVPLWYFGFVIILFVCLLVRLQSSSFCPPFFFCFFHGLITSTTTTETNEPKSSNTESHIGRPIGSLCVCAVACVFGKVWIAYKQRINLKAQLS